MRPMRPVCPGESGAVAAEFAVTIPAVLLLLAVILGSVRVGAESIATVNAAADTARAWGRGEETSAGATAAGGTLDREEGEGMVCATLSRQASLIAGWGIPVVARSCAPSGGR